VPLLFTQFQAHIALIINDNAHTADMFIIKTLFFVCAHLYAGGLKGVAEHIIHIKVQHLVKIIIYLVEQGLLLYGLSRWLPEGRLWTILIVLIGNASYAVFALLTGALKKSDLAPFLRRGKKQEA